MKPIDADRKIILSHPTDNVATAKSEIQPETILFLPKGRKIEVREEIPFGHKVCLRTIPKGGPVIKYGERIGRAIRTIRPGELVHIHNVVGERGKSQSKNKG
ncbi:MAG: UxaA family hydrolase [Syntrophaceae bacterium]|nr:UxaA family hydrolase [Syntrophaceae bacterium]